jgi:hypothetical protein
MSGWDQKVIKWLTILMAFTFILLGVGVLTGWLFNETTLTGNIRLLFGGFVLIYGIVRLVAIYLKAKRIASRHNEQIDDEAKI